MRRTGWEFQRGETALAAVEHFTWGQASEPAKARATSHGGVDTELAVGAANGIVINNGAAIHQHSLMERGIRIHHSTGKHNSARAELGSGTHDCSGMPHHPNGSGHMLKHLLPGLTEGRIANSHDYLIGCSLNGGLKQPIQVPGERQDTQDRCSIHEGACGQGVVEKAHDVIATGSNGIANGAAMATSPKN
jgi:hypothetical protein